MGSLEATASQEFPVTRICAAAEPRPGPGSATVRSGEREGRIDIISEVQLSPSQASLPRLPRCQCAFRASNASLHHDGERALVISIRMVSMFVFIR